MGAIIKQLVKVITLGIFVLGAFTARTQSTPLLERTVTIDYANVSAEDALAELGRRTGINFSYSPSILQGISPVTGSFQSKSVREVLETAFHGALFYKEKGDYLILTRAPEPAKKTSSTEVGPLNINGYVLNVNTGERIQEASVYDRNSLTAAITNQYGYFKIRIDKPAEENPIVFSKSGFRDTLLYLPAGDPVFLNMGLMPSSPEVVVVRDTVKVPERDSLSEMKAPARQDHKVSEVNMTNIKDTLYRDWQVSFVPFVGTNQKLSGNVVNDYSFNVLGGYSMGTGRMELGGLFNIDRGDVSGFQLAGVFNANGGSMKGFQAAGTINANGGDFHGIQLAGTANVNGGSSIGPQFAGFANVCRGPGHGAQLAGFGNVQWGDYVGPQVAGAINVAMKRVDGVQISGLVNYGRDVHGSQIGFINAADSVKGVSIGFLSFVRSGYHKIELSADEIFYANLALRTGTHKFYNIVTAGVKPDQIDGKTYWTAGYGIGTAPKLTNSLYLNFDLTSNQVNKGNWTNAVNLLNKLYGGVEFQAAKKLSLAAGVTLNGYVTDLSYDGYAPLFTDYTPHLINDHTYRNNINLKMWWGFKFGVRFL